MHLGTGLAWPTGCDFGWVEVKGFGNIIVRDSEIYGLPPDIKWKIFAHEVVEIGDIQRNHEQQFEGTYVWIYGLSEYLVSACLIEHCSDEFNRTSEPSVRLYYANQLIQEQEKFFKAFKVLHTWRRKQHWLSILHDERKAQIKKIGLEHRALVGKGPTPIAVRLKKLAHAHELLLNKPSASELKKQYAQVLGYNETLPGLPAYVRDVIAYCQTRLETPGLRHDERSCLPAIIRKLQSWQSRYDSIFSQLGIKE